MWPALKTELLTELSRFRTVEELLRVDSPQHIPIFATVLNTKENVYYTYDFDGVVVQLNNISCLTAEIHFLFLGKVNPSKVINHWHILKKHLRLGCFSAEGVRALHRSMGTVLSWVDGGYFLNISLIPADPNNTHPMFRSDLMAKAHAVGMIDALYDNFLNRLKRLSPSDSSRPTIMKNDLGNLTKLNVLHCDQRFILELFQSSINDVNPSRTSPTTLPATYICLTHPLSSYGHAVGCSRW